MRNCFAACVAVLFMSILLDAAMAQDKYVFAHYMVAAPRGAMDEYGAYKDPTVDDFLEEIREAHEAGIDGFALNCGEWNGHPRYKLNSAMLFEAARRFGPDFKLFFSPDGITADEAADMVVAYGDHPNQLRYEGRPVLSSFGGDNDWAKAVRAKIRERYRGGVFLVPFFYPRIKRQVLNAEDVQSLLEDNTDIDGYFYFGAGGTPDDLAEELRLNAEQWPRHGKLFMAGIAPYYRGLRRNFLMFESNGYESLVKQWLTAINTGTQWVELVTWNDWGEDTYFVPLRPGGSSSRWMYFWGDLLSHDGFREAGRYFIDWFKSGRQPAIERDRLFYAYRLHRKYTPGHPDPGQPQLGSPVGWHTLADRVHALAFLRQPAELQVRMGNSLERVRMRAGMSLVSVPMRPGAVSFELIRNGEPIGSKAGDYPISATSSWGNFNILTGEVPIGQEHPLPAGNR
jgi:hypothetical protein